MQPMKEPIVYRFVKKAVDLVYPKIELLGQENIPAEPSIIVGNHAQAHGPITSVVRLHFDHYTWCIAQMMDKSEVADYAFRDFWSKKSKYIRWLFWLVSRIIPLPASYLLSSAPTIPVYRDNRCITTFRKTLEKLEEGSHIVIFPEHEVPYNNILCEFQDGFVNVARLYYKKTGKCLQFVPMYQAPKLRKVFFGKPISFRPDLPIEQERQRICKELMESITQLAISQPLHTVIPYPNIPKEQYPKNLPLKVIANAEKV